MPIKPENKALYPKDWKAIRAEVLERDCHACKWCNLPNGQIGRRLSDGRFMEVTMPPGPDAADILKRCGLTRIVLTTAHLDHDPRNNGEPGNRPNLAALCQRCHLKYDMAMHLENGRKTRDAKKGQEAMPL